jgi:hypothetical protein
VTVPRVAFESRQEQLLFECPGCGEMRAVRVRARSDGAPSGPVWGWNESLDLPTFSPSLLVRWTHGEKREPRCCHSFVRDGRIEFLSDCTHTLAGQTVDLAAVDRGVAGMEGV